MKKYIYISLFLLFFITGCATVPITGRSQLSIVPISTMISLSRSSYSQMLKTNKLSRDKEKVEMVNRVGERIARATEDFMRENGMENEIKNYEWEFNLFDDDKTVNAFCMPGGKIGVYTGILPIAGGDAGLATVIGHEVAHALAKHGGERMSQALLVTLGGITLDQALKNEEKKTRQLWMSIYGVGSSLGYALPYSRLHEKEADRIGLILMARAGYDPRAAISFWERMSKDAEKGARPPEFLSTHPAPATRIQYIRSVIPEALKYY